MKTIGNADMIVDGHSQNPLFDPGVQNRTMIVQAHEWGSMLALLEPYRKFGKKELERVVDRSTEKNESLSN